MPSVTERWFNGPESGKTPAHGNGAGVRPQQVVKVLDAAVYRRRMWITLVVLTALVGVCAVALGVIAVAAGSVAGTLP